MKYLVKTVNPNDFVIEEREIPKLDENELLIKVEYCGICGSDLHAAAHAKGYEFVPMPIVLGHEFSGVVSRVGSKKNDELLDKRFIVVPGIFCGECEQCKSDKGNICTNISNIIGLVNDGGMSEYVKVNEKQVIPTPDDLPSDVAALTEPLSVSSHAVRLVEGDIKNKNVLVQGPGIIGMFTAIVAKYKGANVTISGLEKDYESRLKYAEPFGIHTEVFETTKEKFGDFDYIFECSGSSGATENAPYRLKKGGKLILVALYEQKVEFPMNILVRGGIDIISSYGGTYEDFYNSINLLSEKKDEIRELITVYNLNNGANAFSDARNQKVLKPLIKP